MAKLGTITTGGVKVSFNGGPWIDVENITFDVDPETSIPSLIASLSSIAVTAGLGTSELLQQACTGWIYQDDDAHDTCSLTACLNPLHPGPCKGWKGNLFKVAPNAFHALEAARVEKANANRLKKIQALKDAGKPIPKKLLQPIVAKPHPHAGKTANAATGEAHEASKAISQANGIHVSEPGKVTLGQAVKQIKASDATAEKGPKGKKPTVASKGIAAVIAQEKVTPQYKLDKAAAITSEQWAALSGDEKSIIRGELVKIQKDGFGPQQKKATELLDKLPASKVASKGTVTPPKGQVIQKITLKDLENPPTSHPSPVKTPEGLKPGAGSLQQANVIKNITEAIHGPQTKTTVQDVAKKVDIMKKGGTQGIDEHPAFGGIVDKLAQAALKQAHNDKMPGLGHGENDAHIGTFNKQIAEHIKEGKPGLPPLVAQMVAHHKKVTAAEDANLSKIATPDLTKTVETPKVTAAEKPKPLPAHVEHAIAMAKGQAPGASWSKNHLAAYLPLQADEFHALPQDVQDKIKQELHKAQDKLLDPKKKKSVAELLERFKGKGDKIENVDLGKDALNHQVTQTQAKGAIGIANPLAVYHIAQEAAGVTPAEDPDSKAHKLVAEDSAKSMLAQKLGPFDEAIANDKAVKAAIETFKTAETNLAYANALDLAKKKAWNKANLKLELDKGKNQLSPIQKASLEAYKAHLLNHPVKTDDGSIHVLQVQADNASQELNDALAEAFQKSKAPANPVAGPAEPNTLTDLDKQIIDYAYLKAWSDHASKAVLYGVKTYSQKQQMKDHPEYAQLTQDLGELRTMAGNLAVAHAVQHTAESNVPIDPDTGAKMSSPEQKAWLDAVVNTGDIQLAFDKRLKETQARLDKIRADVGLKKRALPKANSPAVQQAAAETGYHKTGSYNGVNFGKPAKAKSFMLAKVGPKHAVAHQTPAEKKFEKVAAQAAKVENVPEKTSEPVKLGGADSSIAHIPQALKKQITSDFKGMPSGKYLADPAQDVFDNVVNLAAAHGKNIPGGLSVDQVLKTIDETHAKNMGFPNAGKMHEKVMEWLGTPGGKQYAETHSTPNPKVVKQLTGEVDLPKGVTLAPGEKVQPLAGPGPHDPSIPASAFKGHTSAEAQAEQDAYKKAQGITWTAAQKKAMTAYTGNGSSAYTGINNYLRGKSGYDQVVKQYAVDIQSAMMPLREHTLLKRGTGYNGLPFDASNALQMVGKTFEDAGFTSSSVAGSGGHFSGQPLQLIIEAPKGTPAVFVNGISHYKNSENEMLLAAGTKYKVLSAEKTSGGHILMRVRVVGEQ